jgi:hypothetical protein
VNPPGCIPGGFTFIPDLIPDLVSKARAAARRRLR